MKTVIYVDKDGNVSGLADDVIDRLTSLGDKQVNRVSNVEFDHATQLWAATDLDGEVIATSPIRSEVINMERDYLNKKIEESFSASL
jgi:hypothetical protein